MAESTLHVSADSQVHCAEACLKARQQNNRPGRISPAVSLCSLPHVTLQREKSNFCCISTDFVSIPRCNYIFLSSDLCGRYPVLQYSVPGKRTPPRLLQSAV